MGQGLGGSTIFWVQEDWFGIASGGLPFWAKKGTRTQGKTKGGVSAALGG